MVLHTSAAKSLGKEAPAHIAEKARWALELIRKLWKRGRPPSLEVTETRLIVRPAPNQDSILTGIRVLLPAELKHVTI